MRRYLIGCLAAVALAMPVAALASFSNMYVFGDSLSDNGNLYGWTGSPNPVTGGAAIPVVPFYAPGRFQNGPSYDELLWSELQASGLLAASGNLTARGLNPGFPPVIDTDPPAGTNYAVGGARSRYHRFDVPTDPNTGQLLPPETLPLPPAPGAAAFIRSACVDNSTSLLSTSAALSIPTHCSSSGLVRTTSATPFAGAEQRSGSCKRAPAGSAAGCRDGACRPGFLRRRVPAGTEPSRPRPDSRSQWKPAGLGGGHQLVGGLQRSAQRHCWQPVRHQPQPLAVCLRHLWPAAGRCRFAGELRIHQRDRPLPAGLLRQRRDPPGRLLQSAAIRTSTCSGTSTIRRPARTRSWRPVCGRKSPSRVAGC